MLKLILPLRDIILKCKERARTSVWWPEITKDIESFVRRCRVCCQFQRPKFVVQSCQICPGRNWELTYICMETDELFTGGGLLY